MKRTRFTRLKIIRETNPAIYKSGRVRQFLCRCDCGNEITAGLPNLVRGGTKSCGCLKRETAGLQRRTHGMSSSPEYRIWAGIKKRCYTTTYAEYHLYGGRGIKMSATWLERFEAFFSDMGSRPTAAHSIERIDNALGYCKENCRWATPSEQTINRRLSHFVYHEGQRVHLKHFAQLLGASYFTVYDWIVRRGRSAAVTAKALSCRSEP